jgi:3-hydroxyacyl-[acyl-carrier-protein] dehydratase
VLLCEAAMQAGAVLLAKYAAAEPGSVPVVTRLNNAKFKAMVRPGDTITLEVELKDQLSGAYFLEARVKNGDVTAATFDFVCKLAQPNTQDN